MNICHVIVNLYAGGAQTFVVDLATMQKKQGHNSIIIVIDKLNTESGFEAHLYKKAVKAGVNVYTLNRRLGKNISVFKSLTLLHKVLKNNKVDIVNSHLPFTHLFTSVYSIFYPGAVRFRKILTIHNAPERWSRATAITNLTTPTIFCSKSSYESTAKRNCIFKVIQNGISTPEFSNVGEDILASLNISNNSKLVLCVGKISKQKNYSLVAEIAKLSEAADLTFIICGIPGDTFETDIEKFNEQNNIHYLGVKLPEEIHSLMKLCHCFLNASIYEGLPITVLEAFYSGIPCVLSPIDPHREIGLDTPFVLLAETFSSESFLEKLLIAVDAGNNKDIIIEKRRKILEHFSVESVASEYVSFYHQVLSS